MTISITAGWYTSSLWTHVPAAPAVGQIRLEISAGPAAQGLPVGAGLLRYFGGYS